jgi:hypothetical protein
MVDLVRIIQAIGHDRLHQLVVDRPSLVEALDLALE